MLHLQWSKSIREITPTDYTKKNNNLNFRANINTGSVEVSGSSPLYSTNGEFRAKSEFAFLLYRYKSLYLQPMKLIEMNIDKIIALCKKYKVAKLWVFGSILTPRFNDESDVDFLVDFDEQHIDLLDYADNFFNFIHEIEAVVGRKVDMVVNKSIKNRFFRKEVDETRRLLWSVQ